MTAEASPAADEVISQWAGHWTRKRQLAAVLARELAPHPDHTRIESSRKTAARHGVSCKVAVNARNLLMSTGLVYKHGPHYYKAPTRKGTGT